MNLHIRNEGSVRVIQLNRPPVNAISHDLVKELLDALESARTDKKVRGVILTGLPGYFSAGLDVIRLFPSSREEITAFWWDFYQVLYRLFTYPKPVFTAVSGHSPAGGTVMAIMTDYRIMAKGEFTMGLNEVAVGLIIPRSIGVVFQSLVGSRNAEKFALTARLLSPESALKAGLVDELTNPNSLMETALERMNQWISLPPVQQKMTKMQMRAPLIRIMDEHRKKDLEQIIQLWFTPEFQAAMGKLVEKLTGGKE